MLLVACVMNMLEQIYLLQIDMMIFTVYSDLKEDDEDDDADKCDTCT